MSIVEWISSWFSPDRAECRAVVSRGGDSTQGEVGVTTCGNDAWGRGCVNGCEVKYCKRHTPSNATPWNSGRVESVDFYVPESEEVIEVQ